jgi:maltose alpha-D-glucosyltransferase/alpha-amylase
VLFDATRDERFRGALFDLIVREARCAGLRGVRAASFAIGEGRGVLAQSHILQSDQSNTSLVFGGRYILKLYRKLERGPHPELEMTRYLSEECHFPHIPAFAGSITLHEAAGESTVALLAAFVPNQGDGWTYTVDAVTRFFERVLAARPADLNGLPALIGGVYPERARQLGQRTAELHLALAASEDHPRFAPEPFTTLYQRSLYQAMRGSLGKTVRLLQRKRRTIPEAARADAETIIESERALRDFQSRIILRKLDAMKTAVHGDYHLGQVLNTGKDFVIIDLEGESRRSLGERALKRSPLIDVASMMRSFDYAAHAALSRQRGEDALLLQPWVAAWVNEIRAVFLRTYLETTKGASFLPARDGDFELLLQAFLLARAIQEIAYQLTHRPELVGIPLRAVASVAKSCAPQGK